MARKRSKSELDAEAANLASRFDSLSEDQHVRVRVVAAIRGVSVPTVWRWVKAGILPQPCRPTPGTAAWKVGDLRRAA